MVVHFLEEEADTERLGGLFAITSCLPQAHLEVKGQGQSRVPVQQATDKICVRPAFCNLKWELRLKGLQWKDQGTGNDQPGAMESCRNSGLSTSF